MDLFDLYAKISMDTSEYYNNLDEADSKTSAFADKLKTGLATAAKVGAAGLATAAAGITALTKQSVENYAEYEQLVGGVETLFADSADTVMAYAQNAYKTAGLSANEYMETVTAFSASLLQNLGGDTEAASEKADRAITDMADNANKMGTAMESIQNAYQGFAKQNYTMLDNLKLGYGGTKEEMQRLLTDAQKISGIEYDISSYADIVDAIHVVQEEMGIAGTTAKEAGETISGSIAATKSAWSNLVTGIADENADLDGLVNNLIESIITVAGNIGPRLEVILSGIGMLGEKMAPLIAEGLSTAVETAPEFLTAAANMIVTLGSALMAQSDLLIQGAFDLVLVLADGLVAGVGSLADGAAQIIASLAMWIEEYSDVMAEKALTIILTLVESIVSNLPEIVVAAAQIIGALATGVIRYLPELLQKVPEIVAELVDGFAEAMPDIIDVGKDIVSGLWEGIKSMASWLGEKVSNFVGGIVDNVKGVLGIHSPSRVFAGIGENMALGLGEGWDNEYGTVKNGIANGLDFGTANVDFRSSGIGRSSAGIINELAAGSQSEGPLTVNLMLPDGTKLASYYLPSFIDVANANGTPIANPA